MKKPLTKKGKGALPPASLHRRLDAAAEPAAPRAPTPPAAPPAVPPTATPAAPPQQCAAPLQPPPQLEPIGPVGSGESTTAEATASPAAALWQLGFDLPMPIYTHRTMADGPPRVGL